MKPHLCFVSPYIYPSLVAGSGAAHAGGAELQQALIARLLARDGYPVSVLTRDFGQAQRVDLDGIAIHKLPAAGRRGVKGLRWLTPRLTDVSAALRRLAPDVVYLRTASAYAAAAAWYATRHRARFFYAGASDTDFGASRERHVTPRDWWLYQWGLRRATTVLTQNCQQSQELAAVHGRQGQLCPNFLIDAQAGHGAADGPVVWVGTIRQLKRPQLFLELARRLPQRRFVLVGGAEVDAGGDALVAAVRQQAAALPNLEMRGYVPPQQVGAVFDGAAALINTSTHEGFPNTFLQAWIRGVPSLSFVNPEVQPGRGGTLACADVDQMAAALGALLADAGAWQARSAHVRQHFDHYHNEAAALRRYQQLLAGAPA
ncbi:MAG: glycosyltransferase [Pseudomonadota bacterium]